MGVTAHFRALEALLLDLSGLFHPQTHSLRAFRLTGCVDFAYRYGIHFQLQIDSVQKRPGNAVQIPADLMLVAPAGVRSAAVVAAGTGVHARHQHGTGFEIGSRFYAGHRYFSVFQRLAQCFQRGPLVFRQFVQKQYAVMCQRYFAGTGVGAAADQGRKRCAVMRRAEGALA